MIDEARFAIPERAASALPVVRSVGGGEAALAAVLASADPDMALLNLARFVEATGALPAPLPPAILLFSSSQSFTEAVLRDPDLYARALAPFPGDEELARRARAAAAGPADPRPGLRRFLREETLRILLEDLGGRIDLAETSRRLAIVADAAIDAALSAALDEMIARHGRPIDTAGRPASLVALGFGKLGGLELNYSSDVDLVFLYSDDGATDGPADAARSNREFFGRVVERTRALLADSTTEGHCFRVDLRLRPEGGVGGLVRTVRSAVDYYRRSGRTWERQALIKARPTAGDRELGVRFLREVEGFVYDSPLRVEDVARIQQLKREMEKRAGDREVKSGPGGIRDVEFTVQFLQLLHGHRHPKVRVPGTLVALSALSAEGAILPEERQALEDAYVFLRTAEHRVQTLYEIRTHRLPAHDEGLRRLAIRMGLGKNGADPLAEFQTLHSRHSSAAREILERLLHRLFLAGSPELAAVSDYVLAPEGREAPVAAWLAARGFADPDDALKTLRRLATESPRARKFFASLAPHLLLHASETPDADRALRNFARIVGAIGAPATQYQLFSEHPDVLAVLVDVCGWSQFLADLLARNPAMIDAFFESLVVAERAGAQPLDDLPLAEIETVEDPVGLIADFVDLSFARIGARDVQQKTNLRNTSADLTLVAERALRLALARCRADHVARHGPPAAGGRCRLAILGFGKLGARETTWASDLDVVFVADAAGRTTGGLSTDELAARIAQSVLRLLAGEGGRGRIFEVDPRARPWGRSSPLVTPSDRFESYYRETASTAERMMLTKARFVAGDEDLGEEIEAAIDRALYDEPPRSSVAADVRAMREKLEATAKGRDVKRGFGGIVDVEFIAEGLRLLHGHRLPALRATSTISTLAAARAAGLIPTRDYEALLTAYQFLRSVESRMRIVYDMSLNRIPDDPEERSALARRLGYVDSPSESAGDALLVEYEHHVRRTRAVFDRLFPPTPQSPSPSSTSRR